MQPLSLLADFKKEKSELIELLMREEHVEDDLLKAELAMEKAQHCSCEEVIDFIANEIVKREFALEKVNRKVKRKYSSFWSIHQALCDIHRAENRKRTFGRIQDEDGKSKRQRVDTPMLLPPSIVE